MWSVGVVILELILESPEIFQVTDYTRTLIDQYLGGWNEDMKGLVYKYVLSPTLRSELRYKILTDIKLFTSDEGWDILNLDLSIQTDLGP